MKKAFFLLILASGFAFWVKQHSLIPPSAKTEYLAISATSQNSCKGKELCGVIYVAPWCPACKSAAPHFKNFLESSWEHDTHGLEIIVGQDEPEKNLEEVRFYGKGATADQDGSKFAALSVRKYPSFYVVNANGSIVKTDQEAINWIVQNFNRK